MDNVLVDFASGVRKTDPELVRKYDGHLDDLPGIFALMDPVKDAVECYTLLATKFDTYVLSTAPWHNPTAWSDKVLWVQKHLGEAAYKRLVITHHKDLNRGDFLVDDREKNGAKEFSGELIPLGRNGFRTGHISSNIFWKGSKP